jgi:hypothetical protein
MSEHEPFNHDSEHAVPNDLVEQEDIRVVLAVLKGLAEHTGSPVERASREQTYADNVHLTNYTNESHADDELAAA